jgi:enoyl-CoA hydratase
VEEEGECREKTEMLAQEIAAHPQVCVRADRRSLKNQYGKPLREAMTYEWYNGREALFEEGIDGAGQFAKQTGKTK